MTRSDTPSGFASAPLPTGGSNGQTLSSNEEMAHFATGDILEFLKNTIDLDMLQGRTSLDQPVWWWAWDSPPVFRRFHIQPNCSHRYRELRTDHESGRVRFGRSRGYHLFKSNGQ